MTKKKASAKEPFLPLFFGDFLASTAEWDGEERALYLLLLGHQWTLGSLPADPRKLRKLADYQEDNFNRWWPTVSTKFEPNGDRLFNARLEQHRAKTIELAGKNAAAGKKGAESRWRKDGERHPNDMADAINKSGERHKVANGADVASAIGGNGERHENANGERYGASDGNPSHPIPSHPDPERLDTSSPDSACVVLADGQHTHARQKGRDSNSPAKPNGNSDFEFVGELTGELTDAQHHQCFVAVMAEYPEYAGAQRDILVEAACRQLVTDGEETWESLKASAKRFCKFVDAGGRTGPEFVDHPLKYFRDSALRRAPWDPPKSKANRRLENNLAAAEQAKRELMEEESDEAS